MSGRGSQRGGLRPGKVATMLYDDTLCDLIVLVRHARWTI